MKGKTGAAAVLMIVLLCASCMKTEVVQEPDRFIGRWALTIPGGSAGWLGIEDKGGYLDGSILWGGGSVNPLDSVYIDGDTLYVTRLHEVKRKDAEGEVILTQTFTETITATVSGDEMKLTRLRPRNNGQGVQQESFTGVRIPALPPRPDLSMAKRGEPIELFNGKNLDGWRLTDRSMKENWKNGWSVIDGCLVNNPVQPEGKHIKYGNLRTVDEFEDFNITLEVYLEEKNNSGVYLRGIYEVQVSDTYGRELSPQIMGAVYSRITPSVNAAKPADQWQTLDITLLDRHVTVIHNGIKVIDNQPLQGCTGGALWSDEFRPGPIYLQGDHTAIKYRNIVLTPLE